MAAREFALILAAAASLGLAACHRGTESGATPNANASNPPAGTSGSGTTAMGGPGAGLAGGMNPAPGQPTGVAEGTTNSTQKNNVGKRY